MLHYVVNIIGNVNLAQHVFLMFHHVVDIIGNVNLAQHVFLGVLNFLLVKYYISSVYTARDRSL